ncbi:hypothetical protein LXA43DRAFT_1035624 [Ganoderma leucocontextum]|nr:hypothetical protein LXA43DRAFT_1035624 [Ganoderma leucocontextum]
MTMMSTPPSSPTSSLSTEPRSEPSTPSPGTGHCQALLPDEFTICADRTRRRGRYCAEHGREYQQLTRAYKEASEAVRLLDKLFLPLRKNVLALHDVAAVDEAVAVTQGYLDAIEEEIEGRRRHHRRFFQTKDDGHEHWLRNLQTKRGAAAAFLARLQVRKQHLAEAEYGECVRQRDLAAWEEQRYRRSVHAYGSGGQGRRVDWTSTYAPVRPPVSFRRVDPWTTTTDLERQRRPAGWQARPPREAPEDGSWSCAALVWIVVGWMLLCICLG